MCSPGGCRLGFSILETIVYSTLLLFLMGSLYLLIISGTRYLQIGSVYQGTQQQALIGISKMTTDLAKSSSAQRLPVTPSASDHIIFLSPEEMEDDPEIPWKHDGTDQFYYKWVCYYHDAASKELRRVEDDAGFAAAGETSATAPTSSPTRDLAYFQSLTHRVVARDIVLFEVSEGSVPEILQIVLHAERETGRSTTTQPRVTRIETRTWVRQENT